MMSKKQWFVLLCLYIIYLLLGASFYYQIESREEAIRKEQERKERKEIEELLQIHYIPSINSSQDEIFSKLSAYCGKPMHNNMSKHQDKFIWDFYHSLFFVITVVSTIGYGNLAPTTMLGRIVMIFYALVGIPINGILMVTLGDFFGKTFTKLYNRWKTDKMHHDTARLGLIGQITLYLVPAFTLLIFIPSVIIMVFEGWDYDVAVYYSFVTLTTIGFGDYVAAVADNGFETSFIFYEIFLLVWIIIGLGYVLMVLGFISRGLRSKKMHAIEQMLAQNLKQTPNKFRALRSLLHEIVLMRVKPVYKKKSIFEAPSVGVRCHSCPDITMYFQKDSPRMVRKRTKSETFQEDETLSRAFSDTNLNFIDKELTFKTEGKEKEQNELLLRVSNALGQTFQDDVCNGAYNCFSDSQILESEWTVTSNKSSQNPPIPTRLRSRACSAVSFAFEAPEETNNLTWYGQSASTKLQEMREKLKHGRARSRTLPVQQDPLLKLPQPSFLDKLRKTFRRKNKVKDIEKQEFVTTPPPPRRARAYSEAQNYFSNTRSGRPSLFSLQEQDDIKTITELLVALTSVPDSTPKRKLGTASLTPPQEPSPHSLRKITDSPPKTRRSAIKPILHSRRSSMNPTTPIISHPRRLSLRPVILDETRISPPPPYSPMEPRPRRFSLRPVINSSTTPSPVQRQRMKVNKDQIKEGGENQDQG